MIVEPFTVLGSVTLEVIMALLAILNTIVLAVVGYGLTSFRRTVDDIRHTGRQLETRVGIVEVDVASLKAIREAQTASMLRIEHSMDRIQDQLTRQSDRERAYWLANTSFARSQGDGEEG